MSNHQLKALLLSDGRSHITKAMHRVLKLHTLLEANTAEQALQLFKDNARDIDLLLADVTLETSSGIQVALILRSEIPNLPVILTSAFPVGRWTDRDSADLQRLGWRSLAILQEPVPAKMLSSTPAATERPPVTPAPVNPPLSFDAPGLLNEHQVAKYLKLSVASVRRWRRIRTGPKYLKIGAAVRYRREDVEEWLVSCDTGLEKHRASSVPANA